MIAIEDMPHNNTYAYFVYSAIFRAINANNTPIFLWKSNIKNIYDMYDEVKPDKLIYFNDYHKQVTKIKLESMNFNQWHETNRIVVDPLIYKTVPIDENAICDTICIAPYKDKDKFNEIFFNRMDRRTRYMRYFGVNVFGGHKDCGPIPESVHSLFLSSAKNVVCLSREFAMNARLCNKNIVNYDITDEEVEKVLSTNLIKGIV